MMTEAGAPGTNAFTIDASCNVWELPLAPHLPGSEPLFVVRFRSTGAQWRERRISAHRVWKLIKSLGRRAGVPDLHPHAFRHSCGAELLRRTGGNLRAVQEHLRHTDIQTTTIYTRLTQPELQKVVSVFDVESN